MPEETVALEDAPAGGEICIRAGLRAIMNPDLVQPDEETMKGCLEKVQYTSGCLGVIKRTRGR